MYCPRCDSKIPDGSNICPACGARLAGAAQKPADGAQGTGAKGDGAPRAKKSAAYTKGSRGKGRKGDMTPMIVAFGLILILIIIIVMIVRSMFAAGGTPGGAQATSNPSALNSVNPGTLVVFGAATPTPEPAERPVTTPTPYIEITPTPAPVTVEYKTLRRGDRSEDVVIMQMALAELGYLTGAADGNFGTGTETAVKNFQKDHGLDDDGIAGRLTLEALFNEASVTPRPQTTPVVEPGDILDLPG